MSWFDVLKYYPSARVEDLWKNYNLPTEIKLSPDNKFVNLPTYQEFEAETKRLQNEASKASSEGKFVIADLLLNLAKYNSERLHSFYRNGPDTYKDGGM